MGRVIGMMLAVSGMPAALAVSQNDSFSTAEFLTGAVPLTAQGTNVDATTEPGEPRPTETVGATVWWLWSAAESGWMEVNTAGSHADTVLAVYSGASLNSLTLKGWNDDGPTGTTSRLRFQAVAGATYAIQVGSLNDNTGELTLNVLPAPAPPANDDFSARSQLTDALPLVTAGTTASATGELGEPLGGVKSASIWYQWTPPTTGWVRVGINGSHPAEGEIRLSAFRGSFFGNLEWMGHLSVIGEESLSLPVYAQAGEPVILRLEGGEDFDFDLRIAVTLEAPPRLTALRIGPNPADVTQGPSVVTITGDLQNDSAAFSALRGEVEFLRPSPFDSGFDYVFGNGARLNLSSGPGSSQAGFAGSLTVPGFMEAAQLPLWISFESHNVGYASTIDIAAAVSAGLPQYPLPTGAPPVLNVLNAGVVDSEAPLVKNITVTPAIIDVTEQDQEVTVEFEIEDLLSGLDGGLVSGINIPVAPLPVFALDSGTFDAVFGRAILSTGTRVSGNAQTGIFQWKFTVPKGFAAGSYPFDMTLTDNLAHTRHYPTEAFPAGLPTGLTIVNDGETDTTAPVLQTVTLDPPSINMAAPLPSQVVRVRAVVEDTGSGVSGGLVRFGTPMGVYYDLQTALHPVARTGTKVTLEGFMQPFLTHSPGELRPYFLIVDRAGQFRGLGDFEWQDAPAGFANEALPEGIPSLQIVSETALINAFQAWTGNVDWPVEDGRLSSHPDDDPDGDSLPNLLEMALGTNPLVTSGPDSTADPAASNVPVPINSPEGFGVQYSIVDPEPVSPSGRGFEIIGEWSTDMVNWEPITPLNLGGTQRQVSIEVAPRLHIYVRLRVVQL